MRAADAGCIENPIGGGKLSRTERAMLNFPLAHRREPILNRERSARGFVQPSR